MEGLHVVGDILTKISVNCVIKLHVALSFTCIFMSLSYVLLYLSLYLWVLPAYAACIRLLLFPCESVHLQMYLYAYVLYIFFRKSFVCIYFNCMQFQKFMWHSSVGCWVCYSMFRRENESVLSCSVPRPGWSGMLQHGIKTSGFNTELGWAEQVELKRNFTED
jgi:hypothetical protein